MSDYSRLILGEDDSQAAPVCNGTVRDMIAEIDRLKAELEDAKDEAFKREARIMMYVNKNSDIKRQLDASQALLAEARVEIERLSSPDYYACAMCPDIKEARQEVAREIIALMGGWSLQNSTLITCRGIVARHFGLEG